MPWTAAATWTHGVGPWSLRLIYMYWYRLTMVASGGGYFRYPFKGQHGMTQGYLLSPAIFNVVVDTVLRHWVSMVAETEGETEPFTEGLLWYIQRLVAYFYSENGLLSSIHKTRLQ